MQRKHGFTLVEVLVVIAIIGVLVALTIPAIQHAREGARRMSCENKMRQLMVAMQQYELSQVHFPAGTIEAKPPVQNLNVGYHHGWTLALLPYMEQEPLSRHVDTSVSIYAPANEPIRVFKFNIWECPSETAVHWQGSSYAACHSSSETPIDTDNDGAFILNKALKRTDIRDGLTYTAFLGEKIIDPWDRGWYSGTRSTLRNTGCALVRGRTGFRGINKPTPNLIIPQAENPGLPNPPTAGSLQPPTSGPPVTMIRNDDSQYVPVFAKDNDEPTDEELSAGEKANAPAPIPTVLLGGPPRDNDDVGGFGSMHTGSVPFAFGDGSIRRVSHTIDQAVLARYGSRNDGGFPPELPTP